MEPLQQDLRLVEPPSPEGLMPTTIGWEIWCAIGGGLLLVILIGLLLWWRSKRSVPADPKGLRQKAYERAIQSLAACPAEDRTATATQCSIILRRYLADLSRDPALFETHEEWVARHGSIKSFSAPLLERIHADFSELARWKYAPTDHGDEPATIIEKSRKLLQTIHREANA